MNNAVVGEQNMKIVNREKAFLEKAFLEKSSENERAQLDRNDKKRILIGMNKSIAVYDLRDK